MDDSGYLYCLSNESFKDKIYKIGYTERSPKERMDELFVTGLPTPFKLEFAKSVSEVKKKEGIVHKILDMRGKRVNQKREFFKCHLEEIKLIFELIEGEYYTNEKRRDMIMRFNTVS